MRINPQYFPFKPQVMYLLYTMIQLQYAANILPSTSLQRTSVLSVMKSTTSRRNNLIRVVKQQSNPIHKLRVI